MKLNASDVQIISLGAHVLGGGGGGPADRGLRSAKEAFELGCVELVDLTNLPDEALVVTVSGVGPLPDGIHVHQCPLSAGAGADGGSRRLSHRRVHSL